MARLMHVRSCAVQKRRPAMPKLLYLATVMTFNLLDPSGCATVPGASAISLEHLSSPDVSHTSGDLFRHRAQETYPRAFVPATDIGSELDPDWLEDEDSLDDEELERRLQLEDDNFELAEPPEGEAVVGC